MLVLSMGRLQRIVLSATALLFTVATTRVCRAQEIKHPEQRPPMTSIAVFSGSPFESCELRRADDGIVYVSALVNGKPATFMLDSLWGIDALTAEAAKRLGVEPQAGADPINPSGTVARLQIGGFVLLNDPVTIQTGAGWKVDGLLGYGFFSRAVIGIHWAAKRMTITDPARFAPTAGYALIPLKVQDDRSAVIEGMLDGLKGQFQIAIGQTEGIVLNAGFVGNTKVVQAYLGDTALVPGGGVLHSGHSFQIDSLSLTKPLIFIPRPEPTARYDVAGRVGDQLLDRLDEEVDYARGQMFVAENGTYKEPPPDPPKPSGFAPIYVYANKITSADSRVKTASKQKLADFQGKFIRLMDDTGPVTAYKRFCTPDFTMKTNLFGKVTEVLSRAQFLDAIQSLKNDGNIPDKMSAFTLAAAVRAFEASGTAKDYKVAYRLPDRIEDHGDRIVYDQYPTFGSSDADSATLTFTLEETFVRGADGLLLKSFDIGDVNMTVKGEPLPREFIAAMFSADPQAALKALADKEEAQPDATAPKKGP